MYTSVSLGKNIPVSISPVTDAIHRVNASEIAIRHDELCRVFMDAGKPVTYPNFVGGVWQRSHYSGDSDSSSSQWIQYMLSHPGEHFLKVKKDWVKMLECTVCDAEGNDVMYKSVYLEYPK
jgi:hypothetical protein